MVTQRVLADDHLHFIDSWVYCFIKCDSNAGLRAKICHLVPKPRYDCAVAAFSKNKKDRTSLLFATRVPAAGRACGGQEKSEPPESSQNFQSAICNRKTIFVKPLVLRSEQDTLPEKRHSTMPPLTSNTLHSNQQPRCIPSMDNLRLLSSATEDNNYNKMYAFQPQHQDHHYRYHGPLVPAAKKAVRLDIPSCNSREVAFSSTVNFRLIPHFADYSKEEAASLWLTANDWDEIIKDCKGTMRRMMMAMTQTTSAPRDDETHCSRGLEIKSTNGLNQRHVKRDRARKALLKAQEFQHREGICDPLYLAELYASRTAACQDEAFQQGLADQHDAAQ